MLNKNTYFQTDPLVAQKFIAAPFPYSLIPKDFINMYYPDNKGIREEAAGVVQATKGALENKGINAFMRIAGHVHSLFSLNGAPYYGEVPYAGRRIVSGFNYGLKLRK
ncbi:MAG: hypothetical protein FWD60_11015 [Candidatus Azobacteroides sp.]|nr:hypothetical protein [Candidatus Azobacteroides sp.]